MEHGFRAGHRDLKDRSVAVSAPAGGRAVERALEVDNASIRVCTAPRAGVEAMEHGFRTGRRDREDRSGPVCTAIIGRAVERALYVNEARVWIGTVSRAAEAVEHRFRAGLGKREHCSVAVCTPK